MTAELNKNQSGLALAGQGLHMAFWLKFSPSWLLARCPRAETFKVLILAYLKFGGTQTLFLLFGNFFSFCRVYDDADVGLESGNCPSKYLHLQVTG